MKIRSIALLGAIVLGLLALGACAPSSNTGLACQLAGGPASITPGVAFSDAQQTLHFTHDAGLGFCTGTGTTGITSANIVSLAVTFDHLACKVAPNSTGTGDGTIRWSNGQTSDISVIVTLNPSLRGTMTVTITGSPFGNISGETHVTATAFALNCDQPVTSGFLLGGPIHFSQAPTVTIIDPHPVL